MHATAPAKPPLYARKRPPVYFLPSTTKVPWTFLPTSMLANPPILPLQPTICIAHALAYLNSAKHSSWLILQLILR